MSSRPKLLDPFCCAGGAATGYHRAGFDVIGVDINPQPNYPFEFHRADALAVLAALAGNPVEALEMLADYEVRAIDIPDWLFDIVAVHVSPPCQGETVLQYVNDNRDAHPRLIEPVRELLDEIGLPYVIENVIGAALQDPVVLCGEQFGLGVIRHRLFETNWPLEQPAHRKHRGRVRGWRHGKYHDGPYVAVYGKGGGKATLEEASQAMGIDWMTYDEIVEAIPPAYTEYVGRQLLAHLNINLQEAA